MTTPVRRSRCGRVLDGKCELIALVEFVADRDRTSLWRGVLHGAGGFERAVAVRKLASSTAARAAALHGATIEHANIVRVFDVSRDEDGNLYLVMEWVDGVGLGDFIRGVHRLGLRVPWPLVAAIGVGALHGLAAAHGHVTDDGVVDPLVHGHLSPRSVLLDRRGGVRITPLGVGDGGPPHDDHGISEPYTAPELRFGWQPTVASDLYGVGALLHEAMTGAPPGVAPATLDELRDDAPARLVAAIECALAEKPEERFASADEMASELASVLARIPWRHGPQTDLGDAVAEVIAALAWHPTEPAPHAGDLVVHLSPSSLARRADAADEDPYVDYELSWN